MFEHLPEYIDPLALVDRRRQLKGRISIGKMPRLAEVLQSTEGQAEIELNFAKEGRHAVVTGRVSAGLLLQCQCCLEKLSWPVNSEIRLGIVHSIDEANQLPDSLEPLVLQEETIALAEIIQEELLLAIPPIPQHAQCVSLLSPGKREVSEPERKNPFAVLSNLKH